MSRDNYRNSAIAKIHIAKKQLGLDDETYRDVLQRVVGVRSTKPMSGMELHKVLQEFARLGFKAAPAAEAKTARLANSEVARKIRACWLDLKNDGMLTDASERALRNFVRRMTHRPIDNLDWLTPEETNLVIEALKQWRRRKTMPVPEI